MVEVFAAKIKIKIEKINIFPLEILQCEHF